LPPASSRTDLSQTVVAMERRVPPITRDLSAVFVQLRQDQASGVARPKLGRERSGHRLLDFQGEDGGLGGKGLENGDVEMALDSVPPSWTDAADDARQDLKTVRDKLVQITKVQQKRLLKVFGDDNAPDKELELISGQITTAVRRCDQCIRQVKARGLAQRGTQQDAKIRENVQRNLASQLQQLSQQFRQSQKDFLNEIRERGSRGLDADEGGCAEVLDIGFTDGQLHDLQDMELNVGQRSSEITRIAQSISDLHTLFKELAVLVIDQGSILDRIDYNIERVVDQSMEANKQLKKAEDKQKSYRAMKCILALVIINMILTIILTAKSTN